MSRIAFPLASLAFATVIGLSAIPARAAEADVRAACTADVKALCAGISPGGGRIRQCMAQKFDQLSPGCRTAIGQVAAAKQQPAAGAKPAAGQ